ncbi:hypothetical protein LTR62_006563 [Meristemomyces frigidus]|uniref:Amino acid transporter n=1 Tax=Meristemomyces frigidus TaxID=1508187 RepID=A0AAN7TDV4_9PEZI|nr:hypothetical protein LTR62_006563 [Meristemomyces frigidus]
MPRHEMKTPRTFTDNEKEGIVDVGPVPDRWRGTDEDRLQMKVLGRVQETRRMFTFVSMLGFGSTLMVTWEVILANLFAILTNGGTAGMFWGYLIVVTGYVFVYLSLAEMSSMAPTSGGQYHWVSEFAPPNAQRFLSYIVGWLCFTGWQSAITGIGYLVGTIIQGLITLNNPSYIAKPWQGTLLTIAVVAFCVLLNTFVARKLPLIEGALAVLHFAGLFVVIIVLWTLAPRNNVHDAFLQLSNNGGWSSDAVSMLVGLYPLTLCLLGFDSQVHMSEEIESAARGLPRSIMWSTYANATLGLVMIVTLIFTWGDMDSIIASTTGYPFLAVFYNTTHSLAGTNVLALLVILPLVGSVTACVATASRQIWAFSRDNGVPYSGFVRYVYPKYNIPLNAVLLSLVVCVLLSLINLGSTAALNAILALDLASLLSSYTICIGCLVLKRLRGEELPPRQWTLGRWGLPINILALLWLLPIFVLTLFPSTVAPTPANMNWAVLLFGFVVVFAVGYYLVVGRHVYISPRERLRREIGESLVEGREGK